MDAGFAHVEVIDPGADLDTYGQIEGQVGCCGGEAASVPVAVASPACCSPAPVASAEEACSTPNQTVAEGEPCGTTAEKEAACEAGASY